LPLTSNKITWDYRTKMVDWMIEVTTSFKCSERAYFLSVAIFDDFLRTKTELTNSEVHLIGIACLHLGSKYEDIVPLSG
jgi:hypothetical protein